MVNAFSLLRSLLRKLLAYVCMYACKAIIRLYDANKDGKLSPTESLPLTTIVNYINKMVEKE